MSHTHSDPDQLHAGCDACIERVRRDQYRADLPHLTDEALTEALMARDHIVEDWRRDALDSEMARRTAMAAHPSSQVTA